MSIINSIHNGHVLLIRHNRYISSRSMKLMILRTRVLPRQNSKYNSKILWNTKWKFNKCIMTFMYLLLSYWFIIILIVSLRIYGLIFCKIAVYHVIEMKHFSNKAFYYICKKCKTKECMNNVHQFKRKMSILPLREQI